MSGKWNKQQAQEIANIVKNGGCVAGSCYMCPLHGTFHSCLVSCHSIYKESLVDTAKRELSIILQEMIERL